LQVVCVQVVCRRRATERLGSSYDSKEQEGDANCSAWTGPELGRDAGTNP